MGDSKRWTVTYTKHIKQKRKVYQDGTLEHHNNKVLLYDDTGGVVESRFLKKDEVVRCGETLTFDGHLVDIGDYEGNHGPLKDLNVQGGDKKSVENTSSINGFKKVGASNNGRLKNRILHVMNKVDAGSGHIGEARGQFQMLKKIKQEDEKSEPQNFRAPQSRLEAIKINDRGSKQYGPQNFEASKNCSNPTQITAREWHALYTTQLTQKAKKYHDGIIRLEFCGSIQKQVLLFDAGRKLLDSRFLKKDEVVRSGETVVFDGHLVEVGDSEEDKKSELHNSRAPHSLLKATKINDTGASMPFLFMGANSMDQKILKHQEIVQILHKPLLEVVLYDASRRVLDSRFLKKDEVVTTGVTVVFAAHLVDIGESEASSLDSTAVVASKHADSMAGEGLVKSSRENKDSHLLIIEAQQNHSKLMQDKIREWHALYTTQVTQKAKKYYDGILQLAVCVSHRKQVILLNEDGSILSWKYLNSSEDVKPGCTLQVTNYLVQVGEQKISQAGESQNDVSSGKHATVVAHSSRSSVDKIRLSHSDATKKPIGESQNDVSSGKHVTVGAYSSRLSVDKIKLSTSDVAKRPTGESQNDVSSVKHVTVGSCSSSSSVDKIKLSPSDASKRPMCDGQSQDDTSGKHVGAYSSSFSVDKTKFSVSDAMKKQIRDVHQIMSTLKKPMSSESLAPIRNPTMDQICSSRSSDSSQFGLEEKLLGHNVEELKSSWKDDHEDSRGHLNGDSDRQMGYCRSGIPESKALQRLPTSGNINLIDPDQSDRLDPHTTLSNVSLGVAASDTPISKSDWGNLDKTMVNTFSSITKPQDSGAVLLDLPDRSTVNLFSSIAGSQVSDLVLDTPEDMQVEGSGGSRIAQDVKEEKSNQVSVDKMGYNERLEDGLSFGWSSTIDAGLDSPSDAERQNCELLKSIPEEKMEIYEYPSFDLGF